MKTMLVIFVMFVVTPAVAKAQHRRVHRSFVIVQPVIYSGYRTSFRQPIAHHGFGHHSFVRQPVVYNGFIGHQSFVGHQSFIRRRSFVSSPYVAQPVFVNRGFHLSFGRGVHGHRFFSIGF